MVPTSSGVPRRPAGDRPNPKRLRDNPGKRRANHDGKPLATGKR